MRWFVNYRRDDTGWASNALADALRRRLGPAEVFLDNRSIALGQAFTHVLQDGVRRSAVLVALIGPRWTEPPLVDRLFDPVDWVRQEIVLAHEQQSTVVPVLVDRPAPPAATSLPEELRFLSGLQAAWLRQTHPGDVDVLAKEIADILPPTCVRGATAPDVKGAERTRAALDALLKHVLPPAQQWSGNRARLLDLALALLSRDDRLVYLVPARLEDRPKGSATVLLTETDVVVAEVNESFRISGEIRFPRSRVGRVEVVPTLPLFADVVVHTTAGDTVPLLGLFRDQARRLADHLRS